MHRSAERKTVRQTFDSAVMMTMMMMVMMVIETSEVEVDGGPQGQWASEELVLNPRLPPARLSNLKTLLIV